MSDFTPLPKLTSSEFEPLHWRSSTLLSTLVNIASSAIDTLGSVENLQYRITILEVLKSCVVWRLHDAKAERRRIEEETNES